jgi:antitoxin (DNA-binding transcriptional repressor) of toxin-antitoxin stability system
MEALMSVTLNLTEAKAKFSEVVERASQGEEIIVTRMGRPIVRISRFEPATPNQRLGLLRGRIHIAPDFDDWPEDIARDLGLSD